MGNAFSLCCLQVTYSSRNIEEARRVYDFMAVLGGPFAALTASLAVYDSVLIDWDHRWRILEQMCDDRQEKEYVSVFCF